MGYILYMTTNQYLVGIDVIFHQTSYLFRIIVLHAQNQFPILNKYYIHIYNEYILTTI